MYCNLRYQIYNHLFSKTIYIYIYIYIDKTLIGNKIWPARPAPASPAPAKTRTELISASEQSPVTVLIPNT